MSDAFLGGIPNWADGTVSLRFSESPRCPAQDATGPDCQQSASGNGRVRADFDFICIFHVHKKTTHPCYQQGWVIEVRNIDVLRDTPIIQDPKSFVKVCSPKKLKKFHLFDFFRVKGTSLLDSLDYGSNIGSESQVGYLWPVMR